MMSASFFRMTSPNKAPDHRWAASRDALDLAGDIREGAAEIKRCGDMLTAYPTDAEERMKARAAARKVLADLDHLERLASGVSGRVS